MPPRQRRQQPRDDAQLITIIAGALAVGAPVAATAATLAGVVGVTLESMVAVLKIAMAQPIGYGIATLPSTTASAESQKLEATYRAHYVLAASRRVQEAIAAGTPRRVATQRERTYFDQHMQARRNRQRAAMQVDKAARRYGDTLGWYAVLDNRTSKECREANGRNFSVTRRPAIGYPGAVHPHCRCKAGKAHATSKTVYSIKPEKRAA